MIWLFLEAQALAFRIEAMRNEQWTDRLVRLSSRAWRRVERRMGKAEQVIGADGGERAVVNPSLGGRRLSGN